MRKRLQPPPPPHVQTDAEPSMTGVPLKLEGAVQEEPRKIFCLEVRSDVTHGMEGHTFKRLVVLAISVA
jgi:hypothetical protein